VDVKSNTKKYRNNQEERTAKIPLWRKMEIDLNMKRKECGQITEYLRGIRSERLSKIMNDIRNKYKIQRDSQLEERKVELGMQITALAKRIKNADDKHERRKQNNKFETNPKLFYRELREEKIDIKKIPSKEDLENFWRNLYEEEKEYNSDAE